MNQIMIKVHNEAFPSLAWGGGMWNVLYNCLLCIIYLVEVKGDSTASQINGDISDVENIKRGGGEKLGNMIEILVVLLKISNRHPN